MKLKRSEMQGQGFKVELALAAVPVATVAAGIKAELKLF